MKTSLALLLSLPLLILSGCAMYGSPYPATRVHSPKVIRIETTGYCKCKKCCGWKRNWKLQPVYASGASKGKPKQVGITSSGTKAKRGTIAADLRYYPYGTVFYIPGYGYGRVEDIGSAIKGNHIDLYFDSHQEALEWGREVKKVKVWKAATKK